MNENEKSYKHQIKKYIDSENDGGKSSYRTPDLEIINPALYY
jgi:hypothetical protein